MASALPPSFPPRATTLRNTTTLSLSLCAHNLDGYPITSIVTLPHDVFGSVKVHSEILLFNMPKLKPHHFLPDKYLR